MKNYYNIHYIDGYGRPEYGCKFDMEFYDILCEDNWLTVMLKQTMNSDGSTSSVQDDFVMIFPRNRVIRVLKKTEVDNNG